MQTLPAKFNNYFTNSEDGFSNPSELHAHLLRYIDFASFYCVAGAHYQVEGSDLLEAINLITSTLLFIADKNVFCENEFKKDTDIDKGKSLLEKFVVMFVDWDWANDDIDFCWAIQREGFVNNREAMIDSVKNWKHIKHDDKAFQGMIPGKVDFKNVRQ